MSLDAAIRDLGDLNIDAIERAVCVEALRRCDSMRGAASLVGMTRHSLARRIRHHRIEWKSSGRCPAPITSPEPFSGTVMGRACLGLRALVGDPYAHGIFTALAHVAVIYPDVVAEEIYEWARSFDLVPRADSMRRGTDIAEIQEAGR